MIVGAAIAVIALAYVLHPLYVREKAGAGERNCRKCGAATERDATFCSSCGVPLANHS
jgi:predicted amidophosphoribosyltransferase